MKNHYCMSFKKPDSGKLIWLAVVADNPDMAGKMMIESFYRHRNNAGYNVYGGPIIDHERNERWLVEKIRELNSKGYSVHGYDYAKRFTYVCDELVKTGFECVAGISRDELKLIVKSKM